MHGLFFMNVCCPVWKLWLYLCSANAWEYFLEFVLPTVYTVIKADFNFRICNSTENGIFDYDCRPVDCHTKLNEGSFNKGSFLKFWYMGRWNFYNDVSVSWEEETSEIACGFDTLASRALNHR